MSISKFYLDKDHAKVIHQLLCERMEEIFSPFDNDENWEATEEQQLILDAVRTYSAQLPYGWSYDD